MSEVAIMVGKRIRCLRQSHGLSQEALAYKASISQAHLGQIERAVKNPTVDTIGKIAAALDVPVEELFRDAGIPDETHPNATINKINAHLLAMSEREQKDFLKIIRIMKHYDDID